MAVFVLSCVPQSLLNVRHCLRLVFPLPFLCICFVFPLPFFDVTVFSLPFQVLIEGALPLPESSSSGGVGRPSARAVLLRTTGLVAVMNIVSIPVQTLPLYCGFTAFL